MRKNAHSHGYGFIHRKRGCMPKQVVQPTHQTVLAEESHYLSSAGLPSEHCSALVIEAVEPTSTLLYQFDTATVDVCMVQGGKVGRPYKISEGVYGCVITLDETLQPGERVEIEYLTTFQYADAPPPHFRRMVGKRGLKTLRLAVVFDGVYVPERVYFAQWDGYGEDAAIIPGSERLIELTPATADDKPPMEVCRELTDVPPGVYGFRWEW
jgi:hypothetical protein